MRRDVFRLVRRLAILITFGGCVIVATSSRVTNTVTALDWCQYCDSSHGYCTQWCAEEYDWCRDHTPWVDCTNQLYWCVWSCDQQKTFCQQNCSTGNPPGGGGGHTKSQCEVGCYAARNSCIGNQGIPDVEDCINGGGNVPVCCNQAFFDCIAGCP
jgi:hypothetical protein